MTEKEQLTHKIEKESAKFEALLNVQSNRVKNKFISGDLSGLDSVYTKYMDAWEQKLQDVGRINYPVAAQKITKVALVIATVMIYQDGTLKDVEINSSTGTDELNAGVINIIKSSAPFDAFPDAMSLEVDVLHITRTFYFRPS